MNWTKAAMFHVKHDGKNGPARPVYLERAGQKEEGKNHPPARRGI